jgi:16S rRNA (cytidine1402-2'-O)-methyltransferase
MLTFLPTPIGNLGDISFRTIDVLKDGEIIFCEDTRVTKKLLQLIKEKYNLEFPNFNFISLHSHNESKFLTNEYKNMFETKNCIYMSDAGMPCVSDPGSLIIDFCLKNSIEYDVLPGSNALLTAYASSGFSNTTFTFFGFLPHKGEKRNEQLEKIMNNKNLSILYESPHRLLKLLEEIKQKDEDREVFLTKELTKKFQFRIKDSIKNILDKMRTSEIKGEWVVIIKEEQENYKGTITLEDIVDLKLPPKQKAKLISKLTGENTKEIYNSLIQS